jgi:phosphoglycerate dehydrogenase-like enzyme
MTRILLGWQKAAHQIDWIRRQLPDDVDLLVPEWSDNQNEYDADPDQLVSLGRDADVIVGWNFPRDMFLQARCLKLVSSAHTGFDRYDLELFRERGVMLATAGGVNAVPVAEHALALLLALAKRIVEFDAAVKRTDWVDLTPETASMLLAGRTATVLGMGRIGALIARRLAAFDISVIGIRRDVTATVPHVDELLPPDRLIEALERSHIAILALPLTRETRGLFGDAAFAALPEGALVVNVGRGMVVKESAVHAALESGRLGGFAADVWWDYADASPAGYHYNVPSRFHVHRHPRVVGTPDLASNIAGMRERMIGFALENVREYLAGERPRRIVDTGERD